MPSYRGYLLEVVPQGAGCKVLIRPPGSAFAMPQIPHSDDKSQKDALILEAQARC